MTDASVVQRSESIAAPADAILPLITNFRNWQRWSAWEGLDPALKRTYSGPDEGVGTVYEWSGNRKAGAGRMELTALGDAAVAIDLLFTRPFKSASTIDFSLEADGGGTRVVWRMSTPKTVVSRIMGLFMNMEKLIGPDLERGLANLKREAESR